jgi:eukaryotic-like serine/threonine-protein kinase
MVSSRSRMPVPAPSSFPERIGRYELMLPIGSGGVATVYLASALGVGGFERDVALKLIHWHLREDAERAHELVEEAKLAARIRHPNVVPVLDVGDDPAGVYLVMEYVECATLSELLRAASKSGEPLPLSITVAILSDMLAGLHAAHELRDEDGALVGLVHRDVTPHNILVGTDGVSRLADFGVAKATTRSGVTATGLIKGKARYMAPEQARAAPLDRRCDVLASAVVAWEMLAGRRLYPADLDDVGILLRIVTEEPPRIPRSDLPRELADVLSDAMARDVDKRPADAGALRRRLLDALSTAPADPSVVGEHVSAIVAAKLEKRRAQVAEVRTLRASMRRICDEAEAHSVSPSPIPKGEAPEDVMVDQPEVPQRKGAWARVAVVAAIAGTALGIAIMQLRSESAPAKTTSEVSQEPAPKLVETSAPSMVAPAISSTPPVERARPRPSAPARVAKPKASEQLAPNPYAE